MFTSIVRLFLCSFGFTILLQAVSLEPAEAKLFRNKYISFQLPNKWACYLDNTAWICRHALSKKCQGKGSSSKECQTQRKKTKEAIIILAAKEVGPKDTFKEYITHLKTPRPIVTKKGRRSKSQIKHVKRVKIQGHGWIDGMHLSSEIPHYFTRYLATIKGNIAVLVTFSAHKLYYTKYSADFYKAIKSLRVLATKSQTIAKRELHTGKGILGDNIGAHLDAALDDANEDYDMDGTQGNSDFEFYLMLGAILMALAGVVVWFRGRA